MVMRLQKLLSQAGIASRRAAEALMRDGRVTINGVRVTELGTKADPDTDDIRVDGRRVRPLAARRYLLLNKPRGVVTTRADPQGRPTVLDLVGPGAARLYPVGRLDYDSEGLLLLTNDGDLAARLTHPRHELERGYEALVRGVPDAAALRRLAQGLVIEGRRTRPAEVRLLGVRRRPAGPQARLALTIREGRHRQVRKMCQAVGHPVIRLWRTRLGPLTDTGLKPGRSRPLTARELAVLKAAVGAG